MSTSYAAHVKQEFQSRACCGFGQRRPCARRLGTKQVEELFVEFVRVPLAHSLRDRRHHTSFLPLVRGRGWHFHVLLPFAPLFPFLTCVRRWRQSHFHAFVVQQSSNGNATPTTPHDPRNTSTVSKPRPKRSLPRRGGRNECCLDACAAARMLLGHGPADARGCKVDAHASGEKHRRCFSCAAAKLTKTLLHKLAKQRNLNPRISDMIGTNSCTCMSKTTPPSLLTRLCCNFHRETCIATGIANQHAFHCKSIGGCQHERRRFVPVQESPIQFLFYPQRIWSFPIERTITKASNTSNLFSLREAN